MCGILGYKNFRNSINSEKINDLIKINDKVLRLRGPDDVGKYINESNKYACFHRRLSIIDLSKNGSQPFLDKSKRYSIVFNGEIFNYKELKEELQKRGETFISNSDTEVLLNGYIHWGKEFVNKLRGFFAFAIYDELEDELFICRDRLGVKPLYYYYDKECFVFSSSLRATIKASGVKPIVVRENIFQYLHFGYNIPPITLFKDFFNLEPAHYITIKNNKISKTKYWDFDEGNSEEFLNYSYVEYKKKLSLLIDDAIKSRLVSDVPIGVFLSGGLDSAVVAKISSKYSTEKIKTFNIGYNIPGLFDESNEAYESSKLLGTEHYNIKFKLEDFHTLFEKYIDSQEEPNANPTSFFLLMLTKLVSENKLKVVLTGDGGDELFWGYKTWEKIISKDKKFKLYRAFPKSLRKLIFKAVKNILPIKAKYDLLRKVATDEIFYYGDKGFTIFEMERICLKDFKKYKTSIFNIINSFYNHFIELRINDKSKYNWMRYISFNTYFQGDFLKRHDNQTMAFSVEAREPLLDHKLVEFAFQIPTSELIKENIPRYLYKDVLSEILPNEIISRYKRGLDFPVQKLYNIIISNDFQILLEDFNVKYKIFNSSFIKKFNKLKISSGVKPTAYWGLIDLIYYLKNIYE